VGRNNTHCPPRSQSTHQFLLERLVDHKMDDGLRDAKVAGRDPLVETTQPIRFVDAIDTFAYRHFGLGIVVELETGLDEPNGIGRRRRNEAGT
jgi:hypothetical protein